MYFVFINGQGIADTGVGEKAHKAVTISLKGMSLFPAEIEGLLAIHRAIEGCDVIGRTDPAMHRLKN